MENLDTQEGNQPSETTEQITENTESSNVSDNTQDTGSVSTPVEQVEERKFKLKVYGQERELPEKDVIAAAQRFIAGQDAFKRTQKEQAQFVERFKKDPWAVMQELELDPDQLAHDRLLAKIKRERMTPEQRELEDLKSEKQKWEEQRQQQEEVAKQQAYETNVAEIQNSTAQDIQETLSTLTDFAKDKSTAIKILDKMQNALNYGKVISAGEAVEMLRKEREDLLKWAAESNPESIAKVLGQERIAKVSQSQIELAKKQAAEARKSGNSIISKNVPDKAMSPDDWLLQRQQERYKK
jgi:hypothetical protein